MEENRLSHGSHVVDFSQLMPESYYGQAETNITKLPDFEKIESVMANQQIVRCMVEGADSKFVYVNVFNAIGKIPVTQFDAFREWPGFAGFVGKNVYVKVKDVRRADGNEFYEDLVICSRKEAQEEMARRVLPRLNIGDVVKGAVVGMTDRNTFVDISGLTAVLPITEIEHKFTENPHNVLSVGDLMDFKVIQLDREKLRIVVSLRAMTPDPWKVATIEENSFHIGKVTDITPRGLFVLLANGIQMHAPVPSKLRDEIQVGTQVRCMVRYVNNNTRKVHGYIHAIV